MRFKNCAVSRASAGLAVPLAIAFLLDSFGQEALYAQSLAGAQAPRPLLIVFSSFRDRPAFASLYVYRHDGIGDGKIVASVPTSFERGDTHPSLTDSGLCLYTSKQVGGFAPQLQFYDCSRQIVLPGPEFNGEFAARTDPSLSGDGRHLAFCAWDRPGHPGGWDVTLYDRRTSQFVELPGLNSADNEREVAISGNGRFLAFVSDRPGSLGLSDVYLYDREQKSVVPLPGLNSEHRELNPALTFDGRQLAFVSTRLGGAGGKDIYVFDRQRGAVVSPPGLNSVGDEQDPRFSPDGQYLTFVSERIKGAGERDIYLYDRAREKLLSTPGLNSAAEDFDACIGSAAK